MAQPEKSYLEKVIGNLDQILDAKSDISEKEVIQFFSTNIIWQIQKSILAGEYNLRDAKSWIDTIISKFAKFNSAEKPQINDRAWKDINKEILLEKVSIVQDRYLPHLNDLISSAKENLGNLVKGEEASNIDLTKFQGYNLLQEFGQIFDLKSHFSEDLDLYYLYIINLVLAYIDEFLECREAILSNLKNIESFFSNRPMKMLQNDINKKLVDKVLLLKAKIIYRNSRPSIENKNNGAKEVKLNKDNSYYKFYEQIQAHYNSGFNIHDLKAKVNSYKPEDIQNVELEWFHHLIRFYNKNSHQHYAESKTEIEKLTLKYSILLKASNTLTHYDQIAFKSVYKLLSNSSLKLYLDEQAKGLYGDIISHFKAFISNETEDPEPTSIKALLQWVEIISTDHEFLDYYCYISLINFLSNLVKYLILNPELVVKSNSVSINRTLFRERLDKIIFFIEGIYEQALSNLKNNLRIMESHKVKPLYLTLQECQTKCIWIEDTDEVSGTLFIKSSYVLPINFRNLNYRVRSFESALFPQINHLRESFEISFTQFEFENSIRTSEVRVSKNQKIFQDKIDQDKLDFAKQAKESEFKAVQVIAMFVSIATFVLLNVKIFDNKTAIESFAILLGLAACFFLFNLFFYIVIIIHFEGADQGWKRVRKPIAYIISPFLLILISLACLKTEEGKNIKQLEDFSKKLNDYSVEIESLKNKHQRLSEAQGIQGAIQDSIIRKR